MIKKIFIFTYIFFSASIVHANPIISGISTNEINIDTNFQGAKILLFGAKGDAGNIIVAIRGPKQDFLVTRKDKLFGIWYNGKRVKFEDTYSLYSLFSTYGKQDNTDKLLADLELGKSNIKLQSSTSDTKILNEFKIKFLERMEERDLYSKGVNKVDFLDETLFKVMLFFPKNIVRGIYTAEIYLINEDNLVSFQSIPIYVNQVGFSAKVLDFAYEQSLLYGLLAIIVALTIGWLVNLIFTRLFGKL